jgi:hypothetical protein
VRARCANTKLERAAFARRRYDAAIMKNLAIATLVLAFAGCSTDGSKSAVGDAGKHDSRSDPKVSAEQFAAIQSLAGDWEGTGTAGTEKMPVKVRYESTANGSAVLERMFVGTPHEMVTVYHRDGPSLVLTHYCAAGNQPHMIAVPGTAKPGVTRIDFDFAGGSNFDPAKDNHMHSGWIEIQGKDHLLEGWNGYVGGKQDHVASLDLRRVAAR